MARPGKWPEGRIKTLFEWGRDQGKDVDAARELIIVDAFPEGTTRSMSRSEFAREGMRVLVEQIKSGEYRLRHKKVRPYEANISQVLLWPADE